MSILLACLAMMGRDACGTLLTIAEARGRPWLAGMFDAAGDLAGVLVTVFAAGQIIVHGWTERSVLLLAAVMLTSLLGTAFWTRVGQRIGTRKESRDVAAIAS